MRGTAKGFLITLALWAALMGAYALIEMVRGNVPFAMLEWNVGGKFVTLTMLAVVALGTGIGYASDRIRARSGR